jgi:hypothetical protein
MFVGILPVAHLLPIAPPVGAGDRRGIDARAPDREAAKAAAVPPPVMSVTLVTACDAICFPRVREFL